MNPNKLLLIALINAVNKISRTEGFWFKLDGLTIDIYDFSGKITKSPTRESFITAGNYKQLYNMFLASRQYVNFWKPIQLSFCFLP